MMIQEELDDAILAVTSGPNWDTVCKFLVGEALATRDQCADAQSWEQVNKMSGFAEGIAFVCNLREMTERALKEHDNADV
jgi:hypothetical protein